ncbi:MAG: HAD family phosphatase [Schwartzia sp.]|jgi:HAD superfamily hydrolase (TIGR01509 family)|nr:HAD family phosphatase [Schwartzia sp. (in: firmicutes)]MBQ4151862.1 HAD family phosphatase [Schwartzia sp. (in: firmicutes)]
MKAFLFDMDGVLIDSEPIHTRVKRETLLHFGLDAEIDFSAYMGRTSKILFSDAIEKAGRMELTPSMLADYKHERYLDILKNDDAIHPIEGARELLLRLSEEHIPMALASSSARQVIEAVLDKFGFRQYFDSVLSGADLPASKPDPAVYRISAERLGEKPSCCVVLEDAASGVAAAKAAGMRCIAFRNPNSGEQDLSRADWIVDSLKEIDITAL